MARLSVGAAAGEGFGLIRRNPGAVALWAVISIGYLLIRAGLYVPFYGALFAQIGHNIQSGGSAAPDIRALAPQLQQMQAVGLLLSLGSLFISAVVSCAIYRAVLHPDQSRLGYMRVGAAELFLFMFTIAMVFAFVIIFVIAALIVGLIAGVAAIGSPAAGVTLGAVGALLISAIFIYVGLRLLLLGPLMVDTGQFQLDQAWALTKGHAGGLFLIAVLLIVLFLVAEVALFGTGVALFAAETAGFSQVKALFQQSPGAVVAQLAPIIVLEVVGWLVMAACAGPILLAPWARAYRDLRGDGLAETFG